ncbi:Small glutamine-rich tetratricopeptide repeat-containing protein 2 [Neolecta irregularis DAH-3]|uniref:Small glutamine-rich tetratricopeptide repeat-containing protein 2 n=1 Tax=Neolecta irregularis (strain DAH-3) TaxID=1198029 RepID=A0A1U7LVR9_NEOID|nr:Small glutamine-rich tetratricopeptide repeat-containing protein 2 [Neolecta irregularis DAH-3]|eukprot:OLL26719.1 Small glutamine-rich tetratricopeptide repeat-containing protein 2 [Neolecta irregularis DAH-3]
MSAKIDPSQRRLALAIVEHLQSTNVSPDDKESVEVAAQCISEVFGVSSLKDSEREEMGMGSQSLLSLFKMFEKTQEKMQPTPSTESSGSNEDAKKEAEALKRQGNEALARKDYSAAINYFSKAHHLVPDNQVYLSNRAAAYSQNEQHELAEKDALNALEIDPNYGKAWSRLGLARFSLQNYQGALEAYEKGKNVDPTNEFLRKGYETAKRKAEESESRFAASPNSTGGLPDLGGMLDSMEGDGGANGGLDFASIMNNPMLMNMAKQFMQSGGVQGLMNDPRMTQMAESIRNGNLNMNDLLNNPMVANMARQFGGGAGRSSQIEEDETQNDDHNPGNA